LLLLSVCFSSCENETDEELSIYDLVIPSSAYSFTVTSVDTESESRVYAEPSFTENFEILGCSVKEVVYYVDNVLAATKTKAPFKLDYATSPLAKGQHLLKAVFTVGGEHYKDATVECQKEFYVSTGSSSSQSAVEFKVLHDYYLRVGDRVHVSVNMIDRYNAGYKIKQVKYYFEDNLIKTAIKSPFDLDYSPTLVVGQSYSLSVAISYSLENSSSVGSYSYSYGTNIIVLPDDETRFLFAVDSYGSHFNNGDVISGTGLLYRGDGDELVYELNLYWDDELVGTSKTFPYQFSYTIMNVEKGIHNLKHEWKKYDRDGDYKGGQSQTKTITIDK
jgi:hypothetical protein